MEDTQINLINTENETLPVTPSAKSEIKPKDPIKVANGKRLAASNKKARDELYNLQNQQKEWYDERENLIDEKNKLNDEFSNYINKKETEWKFNDILVPILTVALFGIGTFIYLKPRLDSKEKVVYKYIEPNVDNSKKDKIIKQCENPHMDIKVINHNKKPNRSYNF